jgi:hypothetical protein|tara:strand:- start:485 stop:1150 length:666 start_codon:yes stop_codon:yes gene_type:complete
MADITLPNTWTSSDTPTGDEVSKNFNTMDSANSFSEINGALDVVNLAIGEEIDTEHLQLGSQTHAKMVGSTANTDYFKDVFNPETDGVIPAGGGSLIPGAGLSYNLPYSPRFLLVTWQIMVTHDGGTEAAHKNAYIQLYHDGVKNGASLRLIPFCLVETTTAGSEFINKNVRFSAQRQRAYSGHVLIENPAAGKHSTGLRIHSEADQTRVRVRGFRVIAFK